MKYRKPFLEQIKSLLPYFVEFQDDGIILPKEYSKNCAVGRPNQRPIIMIIHDESTFSANDNCQKVWTLEKYRIFKLKRRGKGIMISYFQLP